jgi:alanine racemase
MGAIHKGDEVVLIGKQGNEEITVQEIAKLCNTIPYEILWIQSTCT